MIKMTGTTEIEVQITKEDLGRAVLQCAWECCGRPDDAGCNWTTYDGKVYIAGDLNWCVSENPNVAALVDAGNILLYGEKLICSDLDGSELESGQG